MTTVAATATVVVFDMSSHKGSLPVSRIDGRSERRSFAS